VQRFLEQHDDASCSSPLTLREQETLTVLQQPPERRSLPVEHSEQLAAERTQE
jgi:hypothetical protein